jgi:hypothetical protein
MNLFYFILYELKIWKRPLKKETVLDEINKYILKIKTNFMKEIEDEKKKDLYNMNVDAVFYLKNDYNISLLDSNNEIEKKWKKRILFEYTPRGNIMMFYDSYKQGFAYYSDINSIPYNLLNTIAMKYVLLYRCLDFFIDNEILCGENESPLIKIYCLDEKQEKKDNTNDSGVKNKTDVKNASEFQNLLKDAPFIKYKKNLIPELTQLVNKNASPHKVQKEYIRNRFICLGKIGNFQFLNNETKKKKNPVGFSSSLLDNLKGETNLQKDVLNYKDYKSLQKK